jgi:hypothetical protein
MSALLKRSVCACSRTLGLAHAARAGAVTHAIAGLSARALATAAARKYKLLYGSTTGNSMMFATQLGEMMTESGIANEVVDLKSYEAVRGGNFAVAVV